MAENARDTEGHKQEPGTSPAATADSTAEKQPSEAEVKEALKFWGYLFKENKSGTDVLHRLLAGIANYISTTLCPNSPPCDDLLPDQIATFYRSVGGNYDSLFLETSSSDLSFIYKSLRCLHSLQPPPDDDGRNGPSVPGLKTRGFMRWQTIQLLLAPEEHVPFLQQAVAKWDIVDPGSSRETGERKTFPKLLPAEAFPQQPDEATVRWYEDFGANLAREAEHQQRQQQARQRQQRARDQRMRDGDADSESEESANEKDAANYFKNPLYRDRDGRPRIVRTFSRPKDAIIDKGKGFVHGVRQLIIGTSPSNDHGHSGGRYAGRSSSSGASRRRSYPERRDGPNGGRPGSRDASPSTLYPGYVPRATRESRRVGNLRREGTSDHAPSSSNPSMKLSSESSESELSPRSSRRASEAEIPPIIGVVPPGATRPDFRQRKSDGSPSSPYDSFPRQYPNHGRRHSTHAHSPLIPSSPASDASSGGKGFFPSNRPPFVAQMAQTYRSQSPGSRRPQSQSPYIPSKSSPLSPKDFREARDQRPAPSFRDRRDPRDFSNPRNTNSDREGRWRYERPVAAPRRRSSSGHRRDYSNIAGFPPSGPAPAPAPASYRREERDSWTSGSDLPQEGTTRVQSERDRERRLERDRERDKYRSRSMDHEARDREQERERERDGRDRGRPNDSRAMAGGMASQLHPAPVPGPPRRNLDRHVMPVDGVGGRKYVSPRWESPSSPSGRA